MIEFSKLSKTYSIKNGVPVKALKNVSFCLPDRGLIFILGRSGSGKSTALHLLGGLDTCTEGEIIIDGKSTKHFSQKEWDDYRNAEVGFVFQDYNLFERFNVAKNISLALELQGKNNKEAVLHALKKVGLEGYEKRSPKELSGGQRQRVAIARALVKNPSVLLADEPTGALDSETGEEIFTLLKELSTEKLIVVVSHDREFAEKYADGILEFADGELIKNTVRIKKSESQKRQPKKRGLRFLSRLQLSAMGLAQRPVRMILTILLPMICFALAAFTDSFSTYEKKEVIYRSMQEAGVNYIGYTPNGYWSQESNEAFLKLTDAKEIFFTTGWEINGCKQFELPYIQSGNYDQGYDAPLSAFQSGLMEISEDTFSQLGLTMIEGDLPHGNQRVGVFTVEEIVIPEFLYRIAAQYGFKDLEIENGSFGPASDYVTIETPRDILGKTIHLSGETRKEDYFFKIVGVVDTGLDFERYKDFFLKEKWHTEDTLFSEFIAVLCNQLHNVGFVREGWIKDYPHHGMDGEYIRHDVPEAYYDGIASDSLQGRTLYFHKNEVALNDDEILLPLSQLTEVSETAKERYETELWKRIIDFAEELFPGDGEAWADYLYNLPEYQEMIRAFRKESYLVLAQDSSLLNNTKDIYVLGKKVSIAGCYDNLATMDDYGNLDITIITTKNAMHEAMKMEDIVNHKLIFVPFRGEKTLDIKLLLDGDLAHVSWAIGIKYRQDEVSVFYNNAQINSIVRADNVLAEFAQFFVWIAFGVAMFACITFFGYIHASIVGRKREIGIFRSLGASKKDVFLLFFGESIIISIISIVSAILLFGGAVIGFNLFFQQSFLMPLTLLSVGPRQIAIVVGLSLLVAITATLIPCYRNSCKKPIDVIRDLS